MQYIFTNYVYFSKENVYKIFHKSSESIQLLGEVEQNIVSGGHILPKAKANN